MFDVSLTRTVTRLAVPERYSVDRTFEGLRITRLVSRAMEVGAGFEPYRSRGPRCRRLKATTESGETLIIEFASFDEQYEPAVDGVIRARGPVIEGQLLGLDHGRFREEQRELSAVSEYRDLTRDHWIEGITYKIERVNGSGDIVHSGLRNPQAGALHAIASHWTLGSEPAVVVMPTGTGKTEVMIASSVARASERLLVVVPTDALRDQTGRKFQQYGLLREIGVVGDLPPPVVGFLSSKPKPAHFDGLRVCNVVVTTMSSIGLAGDEERKAFASLFTDVFFDEAHHIEASTWKRFRQDCADASVLCFTATPFRQDGKSLEGKIIYNFPLADAQAQGYFNPIHFTEVFEPDIDRADEAIAERAVAHLRADLSAGHDHILMARAASIEAADALFQDIYRRRYAEFEPVLIHSRVPGRQRIVEAIRAGRHKIIVCVDMFGEGFDLPTLKVAALHSVHRSLGVTLQFIGRFARTSEGVGDATFVANTAEDGVPEALERLYHENADWNQLVADLSFDAIDPRTRLSDLVSNLSSATGDAEDVEISPLALRPKISVQVYRTVGFHPERFVEAFGRHQRIHQPQISRVDNLLTLIVSQREAPDWTDSREIWIETWDLYIACFDPLRGLLYVHSSRKGDGTARLARAIAPDAVAIQGEETFKAFAGLRRLVLHSVGLSSRSRNVRYQMFAGLDVRDAIDPVQQHSKMKSNVMGVGYEDGRRTSVGCSRKGKIWSMSSGSLEDWRRWCEEVGSKLSDGSARPDDFLRYTLIPTIVDRMPEGRALMVDWPDQLFESSSFRFEVKFGDDTFGFHDCELRLVDWGNADSFSFCLSAGERVETTLVLRIDQVGDDESTYSVSTSTDDDVEIVASGRSQMAADFFEQNPPLVRLEDGSQLSGNILLKPRQEFDDLFDRARIRTLDWSGTDIRRESRWKERAIVANSVQQRFMDHLGDGTASIIVDDDDSGESADVVAIEEGEDQITVYLWHCKYSHGSEPGARVEDLYEVCGQAQKSVKWTWSLDRIVKHLTLRESRYKRGRATRFVRGTTRELLTLRKDARRKFVKYRVGVVQPGVSKARMAREHLAILGSTNSFIQTVTDHPLLVVGSE